MAAKTKRQIASENRSLRGASPPDTPDLIKNLEQGGLGPDGGELNNPEEEKQAQPETEEREPERPPQHERTADEYLQSIKGPPTLQNLFLYCEMRFGFKEGQASAIADYAATTGDANIFKDPVKLLDAMNSFGNIGNPSIRKVIIDFYLKKANIQSTPEYEEKAGLAPGQAKRLEESKKEADRVWGFDNSTGDIRQAQEGEKGLTRQQVEQMRSDFLHNHPKSGEPVDKVQKFIRNENGVWVVNPNASNINPQDYAYVDTLNPKPDSLDMIAMAEEKKKQLKDAMGGNGSDMSERMFTLMQENMKLQMAQSNAVIAEAIKTMTVAIEKMGTKTDDPMVAAIKAQVEEQKRQNEELLKRLDQEKDERHKAELARRDEQIAQLATRPPGEITDMHIISDTIKGIGTEVHALGNQFGPVIASKLSATPKPINEAQKVTINAVKDGLKEKLKSDITPRAKELIEELKRG